MRDDGAVFVRARESTISLKLLIRSFAHPVSSSRNHLLQLRDESFLSYFVSAQQRANFDIQSLHRYAAEGHYFVTRRCRVSVLSLPGKHGFCSFRPGHTVENLCTDAKSFRAPCATLACRLQANARTTT